MPDGNIHRFIRMKRLTSVLGPVQTVAIRLIETG